jgi:hypothetical protein
MKMHHDDPEIESEYDRAHDELVRSGLDESELEQTMQAAYEQFREFFDVRIDHGCLRCRT